MDACQPGALLSLITLFQVLFLPASIAEPHNQEDNLDLWFSSFEPEIDGYPVEPPCRVFPVTENSMTTTTTTTTGPIITFSTSFTTEPHTTKREPPSGPWIRTSSGGWQAIRRGMPRGTFILLPHLLANRRAGSWPGSRRPWGHHRPPWLGSNVGQPLHPGNFNFPVERGLLNSAIVPFNLLRSRVHSKARTPGDLGLAGHLSLFIGRGVEQRVESSSSEE